MRFVSAHVKIWRIPVFRFPEWGCSASQLWYRMRVCVLFLLFPMVTDCAGTPVSLIHDHSPDRTVAPALVQFADQPDGDLWPGCGDGNSRRVAGTETGITGLAKNPTAHGPGTTADQRAARWIDDSDRGRVSNHPRHHDRHGRLRTADSRLPRDAETACGRMAQAAGQDTVSNAHHISHQRRRLPGVSTTACFSPRGRYHRCGIRS